MVPLRPPQFTRHSSRVCMFHGQPPGAVSRTSDLALHPVRAGVGRLRDASPAMTHEETTARAAIDVLYAQHHGEIYAYLLRMLREPELAADLTQDTFVKAYRAWDSLEDRAHARAWLYQIAHRVALDELRRRKIVRFLPWTGESRGSAPSAERLVMDVHLSGDLQRALERIPERQRNALLLAELHDLTGLELAAALGVSHVAARALLTRARESLRQALAAERAGERGAEADVRSNPGPTR
ncbi:MAG: RNA polymerase sigma factor [Chloroflexota bacterium]